jgi:hypothetical protein
VVLLQRRDTKQVQRSHVNTESFSFGASDHI